MATTSRYYDGDYAVGFYDGPPLITYPFLNNTTPDRYAKQIRRTWLQRGVDYVPTNANRTSYTNLVTYSEQFDNAAWTKSNVSVTANNVTAPDGTATADTITDTSGVSEGYVEQSFTVPNDSATYTVSIFARQGTADTSDLFARLSGGSTVTAEVLVPWATASGYGIGTTLTLTPMADGWYRISFPITNNASGNVTCILRYYPSLPRASTASSEVWGAQVVAGTEPGPYIATTTVARTVSAPDLDPGDEINEADPFAYLVAEAEQNRDIADTVKVSRLFSRIPATQTRPTSLRISKPSISGTFPQAFSDYRIFQPDSTLSQYDAYFAQTVTSDTGAPSLYPTVGTNTLTLAGATTGAIPYNHNAAQVEAELDALTPIINRGGCVVTGSYNSAGGLIVTLASYATATVDKSGLTGGGGGGVNGFFDSLNSGYTQNCRLLAASATITGGTFTVSLFGQTTAAIAYNASASTVQTALNALSEFSNRGNCTVTIPSDQTTILSTDSTSINFTFAFSNAVMTSSATSLTPAGSTVTPALSTESTGRIQSITFTAGPTTTRTIYCANHGLTTADTLFIKISSSYYSEITDFAVPDIDTIRFDINASLAFASLATPILEVGKRTKANYAPGSGTIRASAVTAFYLPGVTAGIDTAADIPQAQDQGDQTPFLLATFAGTGTINMNVGQLQPWNGTTILSQEITTINAADV